MQNQSRVPKSAQTDIHKDLELILDRHLKHPFQKPYASYNIEAFRKSMARYHQEFAGTPLILDSCCGTGESTFNLARMFPDHYVIGIDQSQDRLERNINQKQDKANIPENFDLVRADLVDYIRLLLDEGITLARHSLFYPNPWPKIGHLSRRWHGHPVFPYLIKLGGILECRTNWTIYIEEFCFAIEHVTGKKISFETFVPEKPISAFERKYLNSGHTLYRAQINLA